MPPRLPNTPDPRSLTEVKSSAYPGLERKPGKQNWVDKAGGLPSLIERVAKHLHYEKGRDIGAAIATAVNWAKKMCSTGTAFGGKVKVHAGSQAAACKAVAEWEAKKAKSKLSEAYDEADMKRCIAKYMKKGLPRAMAEKAARKELEAKSTQEAAELQEADVADLLVVLEHRLSQVEQVNRSLSEFGATSGDVRTARELLESEDDRTVLITGGTPVSGQETTDLRRALGHERAELRHLVECLGGEPRQSRDPLEDIEARLATAAQRGPREEA